MCQDFPQWFRHCGPQWVERELGALAGAHVGYGVTPEMYDWVGDALIATIAEACGDQWSDAAAATWRAAYAQLTRAILGPASEGAG